MGLLVHEAKEVCGRACLCCGRSKKRRVYGTCRIERLCPACPLVELACCTLNIPAVAVDSLGRKVCAGCRAGEDPLRTVACQKKGQDAAIREAEDVELAYAPCVHHGKGICFHELIGEML